MSGIAQKLFRGSVLRVSFLLTTILVSFFMMPFIVRSLGDRWFGFWSLVGVFISYYGYFDFGLSIAVNKYISEYIETENYIECNKIISTAFILFSFIGILVIVITAGIYMIIPLFAIQPDEVRLFRAIAIILGLNAAVEFPIRVFRGVLVSQLRYDVMSLIQYLTLILRTVSVIIVLLLGYKVLAMALVTVLSGIPAKIYTVYFAKKNLPSLQLKKKFWVKNTAGKLFSYSSYVFAAQIADILRFHVDFIVITFFMGLSAVTHYKVGSVLATYYLTLLITCIGILLPVFSRLQSVDDQQTIKNTFFFTNKLAVIISTFVAFGLVFWGKPFIEQWMGPEYLDAFPVLAILVVGITLAIWQSPSFDLLLGTSHQKFVATINVAEGISNLVLSIILVRYYGLVGVALGTFIPMVIIKLIVQPFYVSRVLSTSYVKLMYSIGKSVAIAIGVLIIPALISMKYAAPDYLVLFILGAGSLLFYTLMTWILQFTSSESKMIREVIFKRRA